MSNKNKVVSKELPKEVPKVYPNIQQKDGKTKILRGNGSESEKNFSHRGFRNFFNSIRFLKC